MKRLYLSHLLFRNAAWIIALLIFTQMPVFGQSGACFSLQIAGKNAAQNDTVTLPVTVTGFDSIFGMQLSLAWAPDALQFLNVDLSGSSLPDLSAFNFNLNAPGNLRMSWINQNVTGSDLPDGDTLFSLRFRVVTANTGFVPVQFEPANPYANEVVRTLSGKLAIPLQVGGVHANLSNPSPLYIENFCAEPSENCANATGSISGMLAGGTPPYTISWTGPAGFSATSFNLNSLAPGLYSMEAQDAAGQTLQAQVVIFTNVDPISMSGQAQPTSCSGNDGCISLSATTGAWPISYAWSAANLEGDEVCGLAPGTYTVTATDAGGCARIDSFEIVTGNALLVDIQSTPANCSNGQLGTALAFPKNGVAPYLFQWSSAVSEQLHTGMLAGVYTVTVTDAAGCSGTAQTAIYDAATPIWDLYLQADCAGGNGQGNVLLRSGNPTSLDYPVTLFWANGTTQVVPAPSGDTIGMLQMVPSGLYGVTLLDTSGCGQILEEALNCLGAPPPDSAALVWPGDADNNNAVNHYDLLTIGLANGATGPARANATIDWTGQPATDWTQSTGGVPVNYKNLDTNGDGTINAADTLAIVANWGRVTDPTMVNPFAPPVTVPGMAPAPTLSLAGDSLMAGQMVYVPVVLGSATVPADSVHGLAFSISYDPSILQPVYFEPLASWLGDPATNLISIHRNFPGQHRLDVAVSRTDGQPASGFGEIGQMFIIIEDDIFLKGGTMNETESGSGNSATVETTLFVRNVHAITPSNTQPEIQAENKTVVISPTVSAKTPKLNADQISLSPNPVSERLFIRGAGASIQSVVISNLCGQIWAAVDGLESPVVEIPVHDWPKGAYVAQVYTRAGVSVQLFVRQ
ncbi:MAG: cohesin domain-containing protein [Saprospiraceae bacterium]